MSCLSHASVSRICSNRFQKALSVCWWHSKALQAIDSDLACHSKRVVVFSIDLSNYRFGQDGRLVILEDVNSNVLKYRSTSTSLPENVGVLSGFAIWLTVKWNTWVWDGTERNDLLGPVVPISETTVTSVYCTVSAIERKAWVWKIAIWLILPVVIRSSQRLSHACLSINLLLW
jgi:hypothetical protein